MPGAHSFSWLVLFKWKWKQQCPKTLLWSFWFIFWSVVIPSVRCVKFVMLKCKDYPTGPNRQATRLPTYLFNAMVLKAGRSILCSIWSRRWHFSSERIPFLLIIFEINLKRSENFLTAVRVNNEPMLISNLGACVPALPIHHQVAGMWPRQVSSPFAGQIQSSVPRPEGWFSCTAGYCACFWPVSLETNYTHGPREKEPETKSIPVVVDWHIHLHVISFNMILCRIEQYEPATK